jgi:hypothetical protein
MKQFEEQGVCVKFCFKLGKTFVNFWNKLTGRNAWVVRNATSSLSVSKRVNHRSGRRSTSTDDRLVEKVRKVIRGNRRLTVREVTEEVSISAGSCYAILTSKTSDAPPQCKICPSLADWREKENQVSISHDMLTNTDADENFLENRLGSNQLFSIPHIENHFERTSFPRHWRG